MQISRASREWNTSRGRAAHPNRCVQPVPPLQKERVIEDSGEETVQFATSPPSPPRRLGWQIATATFGRVCLNTARRFPYPFAPVLSRGLGVPLTAITSLIAINQATGILSVVFGPLSDRWGYRLMMLAGLGILAAGMLAAGFFPLYVFVLVALLLAGLGKSIFDPALQAYIGERVPFHRRGLAIGLTEFSWSGSSLIGIPVVGLLIDRLGWRSPFFVLGGLGLLGLAALGRLLPAAGHAERGVVHPPFRLGAVWRQVAQERAALGAVAFAFLVSAANDNLFVVYGAWLEDRFSLGVVALGLATTAIGGAELLGEGLTATVADRLGLKRSVLASLTLSALSYAFLPLLGRTLPLALAGLFLIFVTVEYTIVTAISLFTEILPAARATMMAGFLASASVGRVVGALMGGGVWLAGGMLATALVSTGISLLALVSLVWGLHNWRR